MIKTQGTVLEIFANKMVTTNLGHPVYIYEEERDKLYRRSNKKKKEID